MEASELDIEVGISRGKSGEPRLWLVVRNMGRSQLTLVYWPLILEFTHSCKVDSNSSPKLSIRGHGCGEYRTVSPSLLTLQRVG